MKYSEHEAKTFTQGTTRISLRPLNVLVPNPSPILHYRKSARMTKFNILGFLGMKP